MSFKFLTKYLLENHITYQEYLNSEHWKDVKKRFYSSKLPHTKCYACGSSKNLNLHHRTYKRIGHEYLRDLCVLCQNCHKDVHEYEKPSRGQRKNGAKLWKASKVIRTKYHPKYLPKNDYDEIRQRYIKLFEPKIKPKRRFFNALAKVYGINTLMEVIDWYEEKKKAGTLQLNKITNLSNLMQHVCSSWNKNK